jgi:hypothetical protein
VTGRFETLIYTDCRPGQGLQGTAGLQFQARSAGADREAMSVVQQSLLYEPPLAWMRERRPVSDYPPSFAHVWNGWLATAAGVYLGREANGGREGNQLTHSIVTRDPGSYGLVRPAQLFGAPFWTDRPAPGMESPPLPEWWQPGPFDAFRAQEFVRGQPDGAALLLALLSALQCIGQPDARRVLFVANEAVPVLHWLTAATLLLPQQVALSVGFKVFTTNPAFAPQQVLAVHPDWSSSGASVDNDLGYVVFDLVRHVWSAVDASSTARLWTGLFLTEDPYDVVDAIEVAAASGLPDDVAPSLGLAAIMRRKPAPNEARTIVTWLRDAPSHLLETYGRTVADLLVESAGTWSPHLLITLDEAARRAAMGDRAGPVRLALIDAEVRQALTMRSVPPGVVDAPPTGTWGREEETAAVGMIVAALRSASPDQFDAVLRVAGRFGIRVPTAELGPALRAFAGHWADHPEWLHEPDLWPCRDEIVDLLRDELTTRLARYPSQANEIGDTWWPILIRD